MNSRTRVKRTIERKPADRVPCYDALWEDTLTAWEAQGFPEGADPGEHFDWDIVMMNLDLSMRQEQKILSKEGQYVTVQDRCGYTIRKAIGKSRSLHFMDHVTKDKATWQELKGRFVLDENDRARLDDESYFFHMAEYPTWREVKAKYDRLQKKEKYLAYNCYGPWEGTWRHRGMSDLLMDLATDPTWVQEMASVHVELLLATMRHCINMGMKPDALFLVEDLAGTRGPFFSPRTWRQIFKPLFMELGKFLHEQGITFWVHCCGNCEAFLDDFIACGVDVIQPLQAQSGMDVRDLKRRYGHNLTFFGNIDAAKMSGPPDLFEAETRDKIMLAKQGGGYMYHSDHSIPPEVTYKRYQWVMELVRRYGAYDVRKCEP